MHSRSFVLLLASILIHGCGDIGGEPKVHMQALGGCGPLAGGSGCTNANGTGIHIAHTNPESSDGLIDDTTGAVWRLTGFSNLASGVVANGWYEGIDTPVAANGRVTGAHYLGVPYPVKAIEVDGTIAALRLDLGLLGELRLPAPALVGVVLHLSVPDVTGTSTVQFDLSFDGLRTLQGQPVDVLGYVLRHRRQGASGSWQSVCRNGQGEALAAVFVGGAQWNPNDAGRVSGSTLSTLTCESGAVVSCILWGYQPWSAALRDAPAGLVSLADFHQACIQMKRAAYCGGAASYTIDGTQIAIADPFVPAMQNSTVDHLEAIWTPDGAACLTQPRRSDVGFTGCPQPLGPCPEQMPEGWLIASGVP